MSTRTTEVQYILKIKSDSESSKSSSEEGKSAKSVTFALMVMCKEPSGKRYTEKICAAIPGPLGDEIDEYEKAKLLMSKCYKVRTTISAYQDEYRIVTV